MSELKNMVTTLLTPSATTQSRQFKYKYISQYIFLSIAILRNIFVVSGTIQIFTYLNVYYPLTSI